MPPTPPLLTLTVATANVLSSLTPTRAAVAVEAVMAHQPDLIGLQEWFPQRFNQLRSWGTIGPAARFDRSLKATAPHAAYTWLVPWWGDCVIGVRRERFARLDSGQTVLSRPGRGERPDRPFGLEPPRLATHGRFRDVHTGATVSVATFHLSPGVEAAGLYRGDRPRLVQRHQQETARLLQLIAEFQRRGDQPVVLGDTNFHAAVLPPLCSAWEGRSDAPATCGRRRIDDIFTPWAAESVQTVDTPSDHRAVVARYVIPAGPGHDRIGPFQ